jgi:hypothetical protein
MVEPCALLPFRFQRLQWLLPFALLQHGYDDAAGRWHIVSSHA